MSRPSKFSPEVQDRAVRMVLEHGGEHDSQWAAIRSIAGKIGCTAETLRRWVRRSEINQGTRPGVTSAEAERVKELERENRELPRANEILKLASAFFAQAELDRRLTDFVLDAQEQALYERRPSAGRRLVAHSDRGGQYTSIRYTERLAQAGIEPSVGSVSDSYDNALAETINGLYKAELIHARRWPGRTDVELATLEWVNWYNHRCLLEPIGNIPPAEAERHYYQQLSELPMAA